MIPLDIQHTSAVVAKRFGGSFAEAAKQFGLVPGEWFSEKTCPFGIHLSEDRTYGELSVRVFIGFKGYCNLITFTLSYYPACCGSMLFHSFAVNEDKVLQEQLDEIMDTFFKENLDNLRGSGRIEVMMVERRRDAERDPLADPQPVGNPKITYKTLWNFFHKYAKRVRTRLEVNKNTGNVLHNMEVIFTR
jgi:hypothetical protein